MHIQDKERNTLIFAVLTLVVIGLSVLASSWQTMRTRSDAEEQHLYLSARAIVLGVESSLRRGPMRFGGDRLTPDTAEFFSELEQKGDVLFVGLIGPEGGRLLTAPAHGGEPITLPADAVGELTKKGEWYGRIDAGKGQAYVYGKKMTPPRGMHMSMHDVSAAPLYLVAGLDMNKHLSAYKGFHRNVALQTVYILTAAVFTWILGAGVLSRRQEVRKAAALKRFQSRLLDSIPDGLVTLGPDKNIRAANPAALSILGLAPTEVVGHPLSVLPEGAEQLVAKADHMNPAWTPLEFKDRHLELQALPLEEDEENACLLIIRDRTRLRRLERSLAEAEKLAAVGTLAAGVAHEVRNPLSALRGFAQYFVKKLSGRQPEEEFAKTMVREADRLNRVITDLLFLARPKALSLTTVKLPALIDEISALLRFDLEQKGLEIRTDLRVQDLRADADALKQALLNLVLNSLEALGPNPPGDTPLLVLSEKRGEGVAVTVRDTGRGMRPEEKERAFEAFFTSRDKGTGLGLALVQRTALDHGGSAVIDSEFGKGCAVTLIFPDAPEAALEEPAGEEATNA